MTWWAVGTGTWTCQTQTAISQYVRWSRLPQVKDIFGTKCCLRSFLGGHPLGIACSLEVEPRHCWSLFSGGCEAPGRTHGRHHYSGCRNCSSGSIVNFWIGQSEKWCYCPTSVSVLCSRFRASLWSRFYRVSASMSLIITVWLSSYTCALAAKDDWECAISGYKDCFSLKELIWLMTIAPF